ncbi:MAG: hypothetical protein WCP28_12365 [Actinomycetes bacterium]
MSRKHDTAASTNQLAQRHEDVTKASKTALKKTYKDLDPAVIQRQIQALTSELLTLTRSKSARVLVRSQILVLGAQREPPRT